METTSNRLDDKKLEITVTLTADEVQQEIDAAYKKAGKNRIPGFRPGKAPRKVLENTFGGKEYFLTQATEELVETYAPLAPDELNLIPLNNPDFKDMGLVEEGEPFVFSFSIEVAPELELSSYDPVQIELPSADPTDEELQSQIDVLLAYYMTTDEEGIEQKPELTDAWVKENLEFETVDAFKERVADSIRAQKGQDLPMLRTMRGSQALASRLVGEVPEILIRQTEQNNYRDLFQSLQKQHLTLDVYIESYGFTPESFRESMHQQARDNALLALALDALARHLEIKVTDSEIMAEFVNSGAKDPQKLFDDWQKKGRLSEIRQGISRMKASQHMNENAMIFAPGTLNQAEPVEKEEEKPTKKTTEKPTKKTTEKTTEKPTKKTTKKTAEKTTKKTNKTSGKQADTKKTTSPGTKSAKVDDNKEAPDSRKEEQ